MTQRSGGSWLLILLQTRHVNHVIERLLLLIDLTYFVLLIFILYWHLLLYNFYETQRRMSFMGTMWPHHRTAVSGGLWIELTSHQQNQVILNELLVCIFSLVGQGAASCHMDISIKASVSCHRFSAQCTNSIALARISMCVDENHTSYGSTPFYGLLKGWLWQHQLQE